MKREQVLSVEQMQHLQKLGLELKETMLYWARCVDDNPRAATHYGKWVLIKGNNTQTVGLMHWEFIPAYTLQDILDILPKRIHEDVITYCLRMETDCKENKYSFSYTQVLGDSLYMTGYHENPIDSAHELLLWCIEQGFVKAEGASNCSGKPKASLCTCNRNEEI